MSEQNTYTVITISREYGAGGRTVARKLSDALGIPWYDKDLLKATAAESGYSEEDLAKDGETLSSSQKLLDSVLNSMVSYTSITDGIYQAQKEQILKLAQSSSCIIVGRCADYILSQAGIPALKIYLYADLEHRTRRAEELAENGSVDIHKYIEKTDQQRSLYYKKFTKRDIGDYHNYDLVLNVGLLGADQCVEIIKSVL